MSSWQSEPYGFIIFMSKTLGMFFIYSLFAFVEFPLERVKENFPSSFYIMNNIIFGGKNFSLELTTHFDGFRDEIN